VLFQLRTFGVTVKEFARESKPPFTAQGVDQLEQIVQGNQFTREDALTTRHRCVRSG
jgi:hypothetical protein